MTDKLNGAWDFSLLSVCNNAFWFGCCIFNAIQWIFTDTELTQSKAENDVLKTVYVCSWDIHFAVFVVCFDGNSPLNSYKIQQENTSFVVCTFLCSINGAKMT